MSKIGDEISALDHLRHDTKLAPNIDLLKSRVTTLDSKVSTTLSDLTAQTSFIQQDLESSLLVSERKVKSLDELYREANAENEALYERFNEELRKVLKAVKGGQGVEEMKVKMKEAQDEVAKLKRENGKLKREGVGLRSLLRGE